jgi:hypothetical protein
MAAEDPNIRPGPPPASSPVARELPPVRPPSGRFIAQLFLVPGLIVFFVVLLVVAINSMFVGGQTADQFLVRLDSDNTDIRWRGANDLAQVLKRKESVHLRTDVGFALDLCERLDKAVKTLEADEAAIADSVKKSGASPNENTYRKLEPQRNLVNFLTASLGDFTFPAGVPLLCEMIGKEPGADTVNGTLRRRTAIWSLANLGASIKEFKSLKPDQQALILAKLHNEEKSESSVRRQAAKNALKYVGEPIDAKDSELVAVDESLDAASKAQDQYLRELVGYTFNFWNGPRAPEVLRRLSRDSGFGTALETAPPQSP